MKSIVQYLFERINYLFLFFLVLTFYGAIRSSNLNISDLPDKFVFLVIIFIIIICIIYSHSFLRFHSKVIIKKIFAVFIKNLSLVTVILFSIIVIAQILVLINVTTTIGWDVGAIISGVTDPKIMNDYLSTYPNNQLYYFLMYFYNEIVSFFIPSLKGQWIIFQLLNIVFIDVAAVILFKATKELFDKKIAYLVFYLYMFLFMLSPWIMVPYTDQISFLLSTVVVYLYANLKKVSGIGRLITVILIGLILGISFLIKPSSVVYFIAWFIVAALNCIKESRFNFKNIFMLSVVLGSLCFSVFGFKVFMNLQNVVETDSNKSMPWTHFVAMGLTKNGGYNFNDVQRNKKIVDPDLRNKDNLKVIKQRLTDYKIEGYVKFLIQKHFNNTDRGDFGWGKDGTPQVPEKPSKNKVQSFLRDLYYQQGKKTNIIRFYMQIIWLILLIGMLYSFKSNRNYYFLLCLKLTIVGAFLYLLIFEGGRSRYLIQYLPFFLILASIGLIDFFDDYMVKE